MNLSETLDCRQPEVAALVDRSKKQLAAAQNLLKATQNGAMRDIEKLRLAVVERIAESQQAALEVRSIDFDTADYLGPEGDFFAELAAAAQEIGVRLFVRDGVVFCYPVLVKTEPSERTVRIDKTRVTSIRPSKLAAQLKVLQQKGAKANSERLVRTLVKAYPYAAALRNVKLGDDVLLTDLYDLLTISPDVKKEYSLLDFTRDIYLLDTCGQDEFGSHRISFSASTATREAKSSVLRFVDRDGHEKIYSRIRFVPVTDGARSDRSNQAELEMSR